MTSRVLLSLGFCRVAILQTAEFVVYRVLWSRLVRGFDDAAAWGAAVLRLLQFAHAGRLAVHVESYEAITGVIFTYHPFLREVVNVFCRPVCLQRASRVATYACCLVDIEWAQTAVVL
jgi:hypothetical protein